MNRRSFFGAIAGFLGLGSLVEKTPEPSLIKCKGCPECMPTRLWYYESGNEESRRMVEKAAREYTGRRHILIPKRNSWRRSVEIDREGNEFVVEDQA